MRNLYKKKGFNALVLLIDLIIVYLSTIFAFYIFRESLEDFNVNLSAFISVSPYIGVFYLILAHIFELDKPKEFTLFGVAYSVILCIVCLFMLTMAMSFLTRKLAYPRSILIVSSIIQIILLSLWHLYVNKKYFKYNLTKKVTVVGYNKARDLSFKLLSSKGMWSNILHICTPESKNLHSYILSTDVVFLSDDVSEEVKQSIAEFCIKKDKDFFYEPKFQEIFLFNADLAQIEDTPVLKVRSFGTNADDNISKRILDIFLSILGCVVFFIPFVLVSITLKIGGGSVFFKQERVTLGGRIFNIYKFRTMIENAEATSGPTLAKQSDKRITQLGHFLRATRLDEIPQIYNILIGDMSIVGPRPERPFFVEQFSKEIPEYNLRHTVKAGLTGLAQIQGKYNTTVRDKLKYDLLYINGYSFALDLKLIMQTLNILLKKSSTEGVKQIEENEEIINKLTDKS